MTLALPVWDGTQDGLQYILDLLAQSVIDTGGRGIKMRWGTATITYTASTTSATTVVSHGLGTTPKGIGAIATHGTAFNVLLVETVNASTFGVLGIDATGVARTGPDTVYWIAIG